MKDLVIYSQSFDSPDAAMRWGQRQIDLLRKFSVPAYVIRIANDYYVAREFSDRDNEPVFIRHEHDHYNIDGLSLYELIDQSTREKKVSRFVTNSYKIIKEIAL